MARRLWATFLGVAVVALSWCQPVTIRMMAGPSWGIPPKEASDPRSLARRAVFEEFQRQNPGIRVVNAGGLTIAGDKADSMFLMSMAGDTAPDVFYVNFRQYYNYIDQGFCLSLDDLIRRDPKSVERANPVIMKVVRSYDGRVYAIPWFQVAQGLYYRKDHFVEAGLDPNRPPRDWDEFYAYCQRLTEANSTRSAFRFGADLGSKAYYWSNFVWQAGGEVVEEAEGGRWRAAVASPAGVAALEFFRKLTVAKWRGANGKTYGPAAGITSALSADINDGKVSMWLSYTNDVMLNTSQVNPALVGIAQLPAGPAGHANEINAGMWAINATITDPAKIEACWKFIKFFAGEDAAKISTNRFVELGLGALVNPMLLKKYGYEDLVAGVDPAYIRANEELFRTGHPEPYGRNCQQVYTVLDSALDRAMLEPETPAIDILRSVSKEMDRKLLGYTPPAELARQRGWALGIVLTLAAAIGGLLTRAWLRGRTARPLTKTSPTAERFRGRAAKVIFFGVLPAAASILVWSYYPLLRGLVIAFQDYRLLGGTEWAGLDNFISVFTQPIFYRSLVNSFLYVFLSIVIGFLIPIFLALALNEIPRFKVFFRTVFYLPAMTSPIVVAFLWRQFYDKSEHGLLNVILAPFISMLNPILEWISLAPIRPTHDWLGDPSLAMFAVVLPGIWAGAGPGSILYLAALKNIPEERYEAADLDGASWWHKVRYITLPGLRPLILINLLGVFIAGFKAMENVFVLTGGGPLYATHTIGLEIWTNAFMFLKFGYATAAAWVMGAILIGFTVLQMKSLMKMKFSTAKLS
ncbi:MAG TPA: extracellular solute-binding protein [Fimbriimonadaceae bacterium]|nr:extracellular solute-binding protein [Fimbriimonadaceae bacterium]HRJ96042.1 extracellular solute-binding protein [Fimbriimonadaceae bacterium]